MTNWKSAAIQVNLLEYKCICYACIVLWGQTIHVPGSTYRLKIVRERIKLKPFLAYPWSRLKQACQFLLCFWHVLHLRLSSWNGYSWFVERTYALFYLISIRLISELLFPNSKSISWLNNLSHHGCFAVIPFLWLRRLSLYRSESYQYRLR